ncbi:imidazole glycerol phosphate synthase subunit HisH [Gammaproteobacteria bacterium]|nr:imidazole glycerol phosphate synthase subunit HisH [Gammaproteobacteria bacterium]
MKVGIVDCGGANLNSIYYSLERMGIETIISGSIDKLNLTDSLILPGVGSAGVVMKYLKDNNLVSYIKESSKPILGICIGMQILFEHSEEDDTECLGLLDGLIKKFVPADNEAVPHMGWNSVNCIDSYKYIDDYFYFANSFYAKSSDYEIGETTYIDNFSSIVKKNNIVGCQFHPEKSSVAGERFLKDFLKI